MPRRLILCISLVMSMFMLGQTVMGHAAIPAQTDRYHFTTPAEEKRFQHLLLELRCMVCENQSLGDSNAPLAEDLRLEVYRQFVAGKSEPEIKAFLVERYGPSVLYEPPVQNNTLVLWLGPLLLLLMGILFGLYQINKYRVDK